MERAKSETETYTKKYRLRAVVYSGAARPGIERLFLHKIPLHRGRGSWIVGEKEMEPWAAPTFLNYAATNEDMHVMNDRDLISFKVKEEDYKHQEDVIVPYWEKRSVGRKSWTT